MLKCCELLEIMLRFVWAVDFDSKFISTIICPCGGMVDAADSKSAVFGLGSSSLSRGRVG